MIRELEKVLAEVKPGAPRRAAHVRIVAKAAMAIWNIQATAESGLKITKGKDTIRIDQA